MLERLRWELRQVFDPIRQQVRERGWLGALWLGWILALLTIVFWWGWNRYPIFREMGGVRASHAVVTNLVRMPGSVISPPEGLPVIFAAPMIFLAAALGQGHLGALRTVVLGMVAQVLSTVIAWTFIDTAFARAYGIAPGVRHELDVGPSVWFVAILATVAVGRRCWLLFVVLILSLIGESIVLHTIATFEHSIALVIGVAVGLYYQRRWNPEAGGGKPRPAGVSDG